MFLIRPMDVMVKDSIFVKEQIGNAYIEFEDLSSSFTVYNLMNGRIFNRRQIEITFFARESYEKYKAFLHNNCDEI